jgi:hypothetical protein
MPPALASWNRWSIAVHFTLALVGVAAVRDSNPVVAHRILELKAETAKQDLITLRKAAMLGNPLALFAAKWRGLLDGVRLARELLAGKADLPVEYAAQTDEITKERPKQIDAWNGLCLPVAPQEDGLSGNVTNPNGVSESVVHTTSMGEQMGEQDKRDCEAGGEQFLRPSQWLKSILPEASSGWWDIRDKGGKIALKFRWRDPDLQVITPLRITNEQLEALKQSSYEDAKNRIGEQISLGLYNLSLDSARRDKALLVARKLGIDLESHLAQETANSSETDQ